MIKGPDFIKAVDAFMPLPKIAMGGPVLSWKPARQGEPNKVEVKLPIEANGELSGFQLLIAADPGQERLVFCVGILFLDRAVCRLDFDELDSHFNHHHPALPRHVVGSHFHPWELNSPLFKKLEQFKRLLYCEAFHEAKRFEASVRWYCGKRRIALGNLDLTFPPKASLL